MKKNQSSAFTLIELLVVIAVIAILALGINQINFNTISDKQQLKTITSNIVSNFETVRGNSLMGKGIGANLKVPESYQIDFSTTGSGNILYSYMSGTLQTYSDVVPITFGSNFNEIILLRCLGLGGQVVVGELTTGTGTIIITGGDMNLEGICTSPSSKILELTIRRKTFTEKIKINTLNGLISKN